MVKIFWLKDLKIMKNFNFLILMLMLFSSCIKTEEKIMLRSGIDFSRVDSTVRPQDDFYRHVNGTWLKEFELPKDKSRYATFTVLREKAREDVKKIIEEASKTNSLSGLTIKKLAIFTRVIWIH